MLIGGARILLRAWLHALFSDAQVHAGAVRKALTGTFEYFFQFLLGLGKFLLVEEGERFVVDFELRLNQGIDQFYSASLRRWRRR